MSAIGLIHDRPRERFGRLPLAAGLTCLVVVATAAVIAAMGARAHPGAPSSNSAVAGQADRTGWQSVPMAAQLAISRAIGADQPAYQVHGRLARVADQGLSSFFAASGVKVAAAGESFRLGLRGANAEPEVNGSRVVYHHGAITEWYANGPLGLEQGFTLSRSAPNVLSLAGGGSLHPRVLPGSTRLELLNAAGRTVLREQDLSAWDARGKPLSVRFTLSPQRGLRIAVDTAGAAFPVTVDPIIQSAQLTASDGYAGEGEGIDVSNNGISAGGLGASVAIDGSTIAVGAPGAAVTYGANLSSTYPAGVSDSYQGAVYVFSEPATGWADATETAKLFASDGATAGSAVPGGNNVYGDALGSSVAISGDTIVTAAPRATAGTTNAQAYAGKLYVFTEPSSGGWVTSFQTAELAANNATVDDFLGSSLAFDGQTIVAGVPNRYEASDEPDAAYVFSKPSTGVWVNSATPTLQINDPAGAVDDGFSRALAVSGATIVVGAQYTTDGSAADAGAVYAFSQQGSTWVGTPTEARLLPATPVAYGTMGNSVSVDGDVLVAGAAHTASSGPTDPAGAAYVFSETDGWQDATQALLTPPDTAPGDSFGTFVGIAGGSISVTGFPGGTEALYGFTEPSGGWVTGTQGSETSLSGTAAAGGGALAVQNGTAVAGVQSANTPAAQGAGAAYVLSTNPATTPSTSSTTTPSTTGSTTTTPAAPAAPGAAQSPAPAGAPLTFTPTPVFTDTTTAADIIAGLFGLTPGSGETENLGDFTFVAYCNKPQGQCAASTSFGQQLGTNTAAHIVSTIAKKKAKAVIWGKGTIVIGAGKHATVTVKLTALGRRLLTKAHVLRGQLRITLSTGTTRIHTFRLRYKPRLKHTRK